MGPVPFFPSVPFFPWGVRPIVLLAVWLAVSASLLGAEPLAPLKSAGPPPKVAELPAPLKIKEATPTDAAIDAEHGAMTRFQVDVPSDAVLMTVCITRSPLVLDILARKGESLEAAADAEYRSYSESFRPKLLVSRQSSPALEAGIFTIAVAYTGAMPPVIHTTPVKSVPFTLTVSFQRAKVDQVLKPGEKFSGRVRAEEGSLRTLAIDVPAGAKILRLDLDEVSGNLDLLARQGELIVRNGDADDAAISELCRESLVIDAHSPKPLRPGRWYVNVVNPVDYGTVEFTIYVSLSADPPPPLLVVPPIPRATESRKRAIYATVDVSTETGGASGTLISEDGLVLTNYHVIEEVAENAASQDPVVIAVTLDIKGPPRELFRGKVVAFDKTTDLALVRITGGYYHQPLPKDYRFPAIPLGDPAKMEIGDPVTTLGFPEIGSTTGRGSVTLTRGVISGFEKTEAGLLMKADASIGPGSSGGAAVDASWRLIGIPTSQNVAPEVVGRMSYIHPISLIPRDWRKMMATTTK
jgi:S1-C subfamily serine protease